MIRLNPLLHGQSPNTFRNWNGLYDVHVLLCKSLGSVTKDISLDPTRECMGGISDESAAVLSRKILATALKPDGDRLDEMLVSMENGINLLSAVLKETRLPHKASQRVLRACLLARCIVKIRCHGNVIGLTFGDMFETHDRDLRIRFLTDLYSHSGHPKFKQRVKYISDDLPFELRTSGNTPENLLSKLRRHIPTSNNLEVALGLRNFGMPEIELPVDIEEAVRGLGSRELQKVEQLLANIEEVARSLGNRGLPNPSSVKLEPIDIGPRFWEAEWTQRFPVVSLNEGLDKFRELISKGRESALENRLRLIKPLAERVDNLPDYRMTSLDLTSLGPQAAADMLEDAIEARDFEAVETLLKRMRNLATLDKTQKNPGEMNSSLLPLPFGFPVYLIAKVVESGDFEMARLLLQLYPSPLVYQSLAKRDGTCSKPFLWILAFTCNGVEYLREAFRTDLCSADEKKRFEECTGVSASEWEWMEEDDVNLAGLIFDACKRNDKEAAYDLLRAARPSALIMSMDNVSLFTAAARLKDPAILDLIRPQAANVLSWLFENWVYSVGDDASKVVTVHAETLSSLYNLIIDALVQNRPVQVRLAMLGLGSSVHKDMKKLGEGPVLPSSFYAGEYDSSFYVASGQGSDIVAAKQVSRVLGAAITGLYEIEIKGKRQFSTVPEQDGSSEEGRLFAAFDYFLKDGAVTNTKNRTLMTSAAANSEDISFGASIYGPMLLCIQNKIPRTSLTYRAIELTDVFSNAGPNFDVLFG